VGKKIYNFAAKLQLRLTPLPVDQQVESKQKTSDSGRDLCGGRCGENPGSSSDFALMQE